VTAKTRFWAAIGSLVLAIGGSALIATATSWMAAGGVFLALWFFNAEAIRWALSQEDRMRA